MQIRAADLFRNQLSAGSGRPWSACAAATFLITLAGCCAIPLPSARFTQPNRYEVAPSPTPAPLVELDSNALGSSVELSQALTEPIPLPLPQCAPHRVLPPQSDQGIPSERLPATAYRSELAQSTAEICGEPIIGLCGEEPCPPILVVPRCNWLCYLGPLFCRHGHPDGEQLAEAELLPPHSRFHPVPTAPVFATTYDYEPPQLMLTPVKKPFHVPQTLPPMSEMEPTRPIPHGNDFSPDGKPIKVVPVPEALPPVVTPPSPPATSPDPSPTAHQPQSVLKRR